MSTNTRNRKPRPAATRVPGYNPKLGPAPIPPSMPTAEQLAGRAKMPLRYTVAQLRGVPMSEQLEQLAESSRKGHRKGR